MTDAQTARLYRSGLSIRRICALTGDNYRTVREALVREGVTFRVKSRHPWTPGARDLARRLLDRGLTVTQAAGLTGYSTTAVIYLARGRGRLTRRRAR